MARNTIYVSGHKNPDSDAIISAMAYAYLKQQLGFDAIAVRAGKINPETEYILNLFNEFAPPLATDIKTCIRDIEIDDVVLCRPDANFKTAITLMEKNHKKSVVITDEGRHLIGMASMSDISHPIIVDHEKKARLLSQTPLYYIVDILNAVLRVDCGNNSSGLVYVASLYNLECQDKIVVVSDNRDKQLEVIHNGGKIMIISGSKEYYDEEVFQKARENGCSVLVTELSIYDITREIDFAIPVHMVMSTELTTVRNDDYVDDVKIKLNKSRFRSYPVLDIHDHVIGMISRFHVLSHANRNLIMVDHNEISQSIDGADQANIIEIIDHHRIGGIKTATPVFFRNEQVGCCCTIISEIFEERNIEIPDDLAGMMCCAIISDTLNFRSLTCTDIDRRQAQKLADIAHLDLEELGPRILRSGASLANKTMDSIFSRDLKRFEINKLKVMVGQTNIVNFEAIIGIREKMNNHMKEFAKNRSLDIVMMVFSLIDGTGSYILRAGDDSGIVDAAFEDIAVNVDGYMFLPKVMSRKLQIIPKLTAAANERR